MPTISQKNRSSVVTTAEQNAIDSISTGETLPKEYIPAINLSNLIDLTQSVGSQGNAADTGIVGSFTQSIWDRIIGVAKIKVSQIFGNSAAAITASKISSALILPEAGTVLKDWNSAGNYIGTQLISLTDALTLAKRRAVRYLTPLYLGINGNTANNPTLFPTGGTVTWANFSLVAKRTDEVFEIDASVFAFIDGNYLYVNLIRSASSDFSGSTDMGYFTFTGNTSNTSCLSRWVDSLPKTEGSTYYYKLTIRRDPGVAFNNIYGDGAGAVGRNYIVVRAYDKSVFNDNYVSNPI